MTFSRSTRRVAASFLAQKNIDCCLMRRYLSACLFLQLPFFIHLLAMFGPWAPNGYYIFLSACSPCLGPELRMAICLRRFRLSAIYIYIFIRLLAMFGPWAPNGYLASNPLFALAALPPHGNILLALRPRLPPHGKIDFLFASWRM